MNILIVTADGSEKKANLCAECFKKNMPQHHIHFLCSKDTYSKTNKLADFIDESSIIDHEQYTSSFHAMYPNSMRRANWYYRQFIKMGYSEIIAAEEYVVFDCDTFPLREIQFKKGNKYCFNRKSEHHIPYFDTMRKIFGNLNIEQSSFISEYMIFNSSIMLEMIGKNRNLDVTRPWYENVLLSIDKNEIAYSGFAEYETYGTYVNTFHREIVENVNLQTKRDGRYLFNGIPSYDEIMKYSNQYDTITIENW